MNEIKNCEVCGESHLESVLNLGLHPMCDDLIQVGDNRTCREYPIEILLCNTCMTAHQRYQVPKEELFPADYHYRSRFTVDVLKGMESLVESCEDNFGSLKDKMVLDIGCNDGSLLDFFKNSGALTVGIEPTDAYKDAEDRHTVYNNYLSKDVAEQVVFKHGKPDFITFTNVFAHIEDLRAMLEALKMLMKEDTVVVIENHYLGSVFDSSQFDTFYHEHPRTYSYTSFVYMANSLNSKIFGVEFPSRYGGNIRVFLGVNPDLALNDNELKDRIINNEKTFKNKFKELESNIATWLTRKKPVINELVEKYGKIKAKAFPGRAAILVKMLGLNEDHISAVYEKDGSLKVGNYLPGTRIPILSDADLFSSGDKNLPIINMAWHISGEINNYMIKSGYTGEIIDILSLEDYE
jgi:hypothetical protein